MKKIIFMLLCLCSIKVVLAGDLKLDELNYYVVLTGDNTEYHVPLKKIYDKDNYDEVFALEPSRYALVFNYERLIDISLYGKYYNEDNINLFNKIVYYYNQNKSDLNYIYTQLLIWELICNYKITITDYYRNKILEYNDLYQEYANKVKDFIIMDEFSDTKYSMELWDTLTIPYKNASLLLDNPSISSINITNDNKNVYINADKVGEYQIEFNKDIASENYVYVNYYKYYFWQFKGKIKNDYLNLDVKGINLKIKENIVGINNKFGDAKYENSNYKLYLNNELKLNINNLDNNFIKRNSSYILKDNSSNSGISNVEDISFTVSDKDYELEINKYIISKDINVDIKDNYIYYVYLKSNNELYETIDKNTNSITLPYGKYYINSKDNDYYNEIDVIDNNDDSLIIDNNIKVDEIENNNQNIDIIEVNDMKNNIIENIDIEEVIEQDIINPKTIDNIYLYVMLFLSSLSSLGVIKKLINN